MTWMAGLQVASARLCDLQFQHVSARPESLLVRWGYTKIWVFACCCCPGATRAVWPECPGRKLQMFEMGQSAKRPDDCIIDAQTHTYAYKKF